MRSVFHDKSEWSGVVNLNVCLVVCDHWMQLPAEPADVSSMTYTPSIQSNH